MLKNIRLTNTLSIAAIIFGQVLRETTQTVYLRTSIVSINKYSLLKSLNIYFKSISGFFNSIAFVIIYIQQVQREWAGYTPHRLKTNFCSLSHGKFWMWRWRLDTSHENWRQQGITLNLVSTRKRRQSWAAKLNMDILAGMKWIWRDFTRVTFSWSRLVNTKFNVLPNCLVSRICLDQKIVYINILCS